MAKMKLESVSSDGTCCISEAPAGVYVVTQERKQDWIGNVVVVPDCGGPIRMTGDCKPRAFTTEVARQAGMRVRPLRPGEKLVCVE